MGTHSLYREAKLRLFGLTGKLFGHKVHKKEVYVY